MQPLLMAETLNLINQLSIRLEMIKYINNIKALKNIFNFNEEKLFRYFLGFTMSLAAVFTIFLLIEAIIITLSLVKVDPNFIKKEKIVNLFYVFAVPFAVLSLLFQFSSVTENKQFRKELIEFGGKWFSIFTIFIIVIFSKEVTNLHYNSEENYDVVRVFTYILHNFAINYMLLYITFIGLFSIKILIKIIFFLNGHNKSNTDILTVMSKYKKSLLMVLICLISLYLYVHFSIDNPPNMFLKI
jgi:hypothetical protein